MPLNCRVCGHLVSEAKPFCPYCGARIVRQSQGPPVWKVVLAVLVTLVVLGIGAMGALWAFCLVVATGMGMGGGQINQQASMQQVLAILIGLAVLFVLWVVGIIKLLK